MKLTSENQDEVDCRPLNRNTGVAIPAWLQKQCKRYEADQACVPEIGASGPSKPG